MMDGLQNITGKPLFIVGSNGERRWHLLKGIGHYAGHEYVFWEDRKIDLADDYSKTWLAYRHKPEEISETVYCKDCKHLFFKDMSAFCLYKTGPRMYDGSCEHGEKRTLTEGTT